ncbi:MAG: Hpt domain protein [Lacunisphaera sp.]|jgi:HPt (histidine-containing phosphotransfer) domain-containing protein|nr:Hpt domain protein [Lacunisphaera sp.]MDB6166918.1 Hpt domain protein [Lacunisphaera sp.]
MSDQAIDPAAIDNLRALSPDPDGSFLRELIEIFLQDTPERFTELDATLAKGDTAAAMRAAHTIKGSSGNFGASRLAKLAQEVEAHAKAGNLPAATAAVPAFKAEYAKVAAALTQISQGT